MTDRIAELNDLVVYHLRQTLSHIRTGTWVYPDQPRVDAKKPRIAVEIASMPDRLFETGAWSKGRVRTPTVSIDIYTDAQFIYSTAGRQYSGTLLRDHLADLVYGELTLSKSSLWKSASIEGISESGGTLFPYNENDDIYHRQVRYSFEIYK